GGYGKGRKPTGPAPAARSPTTGVITSERRRRIRRPSERLIVPGRPPGGFRACEPRTGGVAPGTGKSGRLAGGLSEGQSSRHGGRGEDHPHEENGLQQADLRQPRGH